MPISKYTYTKYLYLAPGEYSTYILSIVQTYYSKYLYSVQMYYSTNILKYLYLPGKSSTCVLDHHHRTGQNYLYNLFRIKEYLYSCFSFPNKAMIGYQQKEENNQPN